MLNEKKCCLWTGFLSLTSQKSLFAALDKKNIIQLLFDNNLPPPKKNETYTFSSFFSKKSRNFALRIQINFIQIKNALDMIKFLKSDLLFSFISGQYFWKLIKYFLVPCLLSIVLSIFHPYLFIIKS